MYILHLEDDKMLAEIFQVAVTSYDPSIEIQHFVNGEKASAHIRNHMDDIAVLVLDIRVIGAMDGIEVAGQARELGYEGPIFVSSAYQKPKTETMETLQCKWMAKPWQIMDVALELVPIVKQKTELKRVAS